MTRASRRFTLRRRSTRTSGSKHILCEKPIAANVKDVKEAVRVCRRNKVFLQEGYMMKFHGAHRKIAELIRKGKLGKVAYMRAQLSCWYPPMKGAWRQNPRLGGGGALIDMATHLYDLLEFFVGPAKRIVAMTGNLVQKYKSEDSATTLLEFACGTQATVDTFFNIPDEASRTRLEVYGSKGAILTEGTVGQSVGGKMEGIFGLGTGGYDATQNKDVARTFRRIPFAKVNPYTAECDYFADCVLKRREPEINGPDDAIHIAELTGKAYASFKQKRILAV